MRTAFMAIVSGLIATSMTYGFDDKKTLKPHRCGTIRRLHVLGNIYLASQPTAEDFDLAKKQGIKTVINLREKREMTWDEAGHVKKLGLSYVWIPFSRPSTLTDKVLDDALKALRDKKNQPVMLHCASANRVGAIWMAYRVLEDKLPVEKALEEGKTVGLRTAGFVEKVKQYISKQKK